MKKPDSSSGQHPLAVVDEALRAEFRGTLAASLTASEPDVGATFGLLGELVGRLGDSAADSGMRRLWRFAGAFCEGLAMGDIVPDRESRLLLGQLGLALESTAVREEPGAEKGGASFDRLARQLRLRMARRLDPASPRIRALNEEAGLDCRIDHGPSPGASRAPETTTGEGGRPGAEAAALLDAIGEDLQRWRASGAGNPPLGSLRTSFAALAKWAESRDRAQVAGLACSVGRLLSLSEGKKGAALDGLTDLLEEVRDGLQIELSDEPAARTDHVESLNTLVSLLLPDSRQPDPQRQTPRMKDETK